MERSEINNRLTERQLLNLLGSAGVSGALLSQPISATETNGENEEIVSTDTENRTNDKTIEDIAVETAKHPTQSLVAFTTPVFKDDPQIYVATGVNTADNVHLPNVEDPEDITDTASVEKLTRVADVELGFPFDLRWDDEKTLQYWDSGEILSQRITPSGEVTDAKVVGTRQIPRIFDDSDASFGTQQVGFEECFDVPLYGEACFSTGDFLDDRTYSCVGGSTPPLLAADATFIDASLGGISVNLDFWIGFQLRRFDTCVWLGSEAGQICVTNCYTEIPTIAALEEQATEFLNDFDLGPLRFVTGVLATALAALLLAIITGLSIAFGTAG
ncbi:hypothetical protein [Halalkalicoccus tibetensis]|uniref:Uncharacterized protein n=1 Tax=Halalkalicoccus tibetensis TaxID=175632 RepID=A0ABD5V0T1_9EURY